MALIIPSHIKPARPLAAFSTLDLIEELGTRGEMSELTVEKGLPLLDRQDSGVDFDKVRNAMFAEMFREIGQALLTSDFPFTGAGLKAGLPNEHLIARVLVIRHPSRAQ